MGSKSSAGFRQSGTIDSHEIITRGWNLRNGDITLGPLFILVSIFCVAFGTLYAFVILFCFCSYGLEWSNLTFLNQPLIIIIACGNMKDWLHEEISSSSLFPRHHMLNMYFLTWLYQSISWNITLVLEYLICFLCSTTFCGLYLSFSGFSLLVQNLQT